MSVIRFAKVVSNLPQQLEPDTIYLVRTGNGFNLYCTDTTGSIAYLIGNAGTATKLQTPRTITIGNTSKSFDGSANVSWSLNEIGAAAATHNHTIANVTGLQAQLDSLASSKLDVAATSFGGNAATATKLQTPRTITIGNTSKSFDGSANVSWSLNEIGAAAATHNHTIANVTGLQAQLDSLASSKLDVAATSFGGNAATATKLQTPRTLTIGNTSKAFDGSANVSWSLNEIGVTAFGIGGAAASVPGNNIDSNTIPTGFYYVTPTTSGTKPAGDDGYGHLIVSRGGNGITARQLYLDNQSNRISTRVYVDTAWSEWRDLYYISANPTIIGLVQAATGGGAGTYVRIDENFAPKTTDAAFFNNHPTYSGIVTQTIDDQQMVKIPKFWFKAGTVPSGTYAGKTYWMISDQPAPGFSVHPAFIGAGGVELDQIWVGKYQASSSGGKLQSVPGVAPRVSLDFPTARAEAYARNTGGVSGFRLWSYYDLAAIQMLASIEMGGLDMQALIGQGRVSAGSAANVDAADVAQATWRGIVGLWGNVWQMVDGLKRNSGTWWRWQYNVPGNTTTSDFATGYINTGRAALTSNGYPVDFDTTLLSAGIIVPATVDGTASNGSTGDYFFTNTNTDDRIVHHGGSSGSGAFSGLFYLNVSNPPTGAGIYFGCRLAKV